MNCSIASSLTILKPQHTLMPAPSTASTAMRAGNAIWPPFLSGPSTDASRDVVASPKRPAAKENAQPTRSNPGTGNSRTQLRGTGTAPGKYVHLDHTQLDIELVSSLGTPLGRPYATFATDAYSRRLLACYLSFDPPSYRSCMMVLRACVRRHARFPQMVVVDGGPEFKSTYFESLLSRYSCTRKTQNRVPSRAQEVSSSGCSGPPTPNLSTICLAIPRRQSSRAC